MAALLAIRTDSDLQVQEDDVRNGMDSEMRSVEIRHDGLRVGWSCGVRSSGLIVVLDEDSHHQVERTLSLEFSSQFQVVCVWKKILPTAAFRFLPS